MKGIKAIFFLWIISSCNESIDVTGHWHIQKVKSKGTYIVMDVSGDGIAYLGKNSIYGSIEGIYNPFEKTLDFPGECGSLNFEYELSGNKILLKNYLEDYIGKRCDNNCCNKLLDFKNDIKLEINFPQIKRSRKKLKPIEFENEERLEELLVGTSKEEFDNFNEDKIRIELAGKFAEIDDIGIWAEAVKIKYSEQVRDRVKFRIIADRNILLLDLKPVVDELKSNGIHRIFLTCLKEKFEIEEGMFEYIQIDEISFDEKSKLHEEVD